MDGETTPQEAYDMMEYQVSEGNLQGNFVNSLMKQFQTKGRLSASQITWAVKLSKEAAHKESDPMAYESSDSSDEGDFIELVQFMKKSDLKKARMTFNMHGIKTTLSLAPAHGKNPDHIYVKCNDNYVGKVTPNGDLVARDSHYKTHALTLFHQIIEDGVEAFILSYGKKSGNCCLCSRTLTDERSLVAGVGPICAARYKIAWG